MKRLLDDLLDAARVSQGRIVLERRVLDLRELVQQGLDAARPLLDERRHRIEVAMPEEPALVEGDSDRLVEVVSNLLTNAAKYSPPEGLVRVAVTASDAWVELRVLDRGQGIAPELLPNVFDLFVQSERGYHRPEGGLGIGLTLVRKIVEMHDGEVEAESEGKGRGSEFTVRLPKASGPREAGGGAGEAPRSGRRRRVLVVEDNRDVGEMLVLLLEAQGHQVTLAEDGERALERLAQETPDVMLIDIGLPTLDGYELARRVRSREGPQPLLVAVTGYGTRKDRHRAQSAGFDHHLVKPVQAGKLEEILGAG